MSEKQFSACVSLNGINAMIFETGGRRFFTLMPEESRIPLYRRQILENDCCGSLLPMSFVSEKEKLQAYYDCGGFVQLKDIYSYWNRNKENIASATVDTIIAVVKCVISAENYLFYCEDFCINLDTVFISPSTGKVRLAYLPETEVRTGIAERIAFLIKDTAMIACDEQWSIYAEELYQKILHCNESLSAIEKMLRETGREIRNNRWPEKSNLRAEEQQ